LIMAAATPSVMAEPRETFWSSLHALNITRIFIAGVLFVYWGFNQSKEILPDGQLFSRQASAAYLGLALLFAAFGFWYRRHFLLQLLTQILVDIVIISMLYVTTDGMKSGLAILYLFPLASAAVLVRLVLALFFASLVTIVLLLETGYRMFHHDADARPMQAGLYGAAFLASVFVLNRLAAKLIRQEALAEQRGNDLQIQMAINRLAIAHIDDGIMVISTNGTILACNPSAEKMLNLPLSCDPPSRRLTDIPFLQPLADAFVAWKGKPDDRKEEDGSLSTYLVIKHGEDGPLPNDDFPGGVQQALAAHLEVRFAAIRAEILHEERSVIFLQDVAKIESQAQQLKLASMGRLTASIAHEVRNPLAAITHASALLGEEISNPGQARLLSIIAENAARMNRMIVDILNLSRMAQSQEIIELSEILAEIKTFFQNTHGLAEDVLRVDIAKGSRALFDSLHLREVVINLLTNAIRYASGKPDSIRISIMRTTPYRLELHVQDDGPGITPEVRAHLFEPFYTTSSKGTGLGLYLARELCLNNGALLDYEFHRNGHDMQEPVSGRFVITFAAVDHL